MTGRYQKESTNTCGIEPEDIQWPLSAVWIYHKNYVIIMCHIKRASENIIHLILGEKTPSLKGLQL